MSITQYIKEIGRGKEGARHLSTEQARELMHLILSDQVSDLELGAFCIAMRIKGETPQEMVGFLQAMQSSILPVEVEMHGTKSADTSQLHKPVIIIPSYNGARKLPNLTPLLAGALAQKGFSVLVHGHSTEDKRVSTQEIFEKLKWPCILDSCASNPLLLPKEKAVYVSMKCLSLNISKLLDIRRTLGLRNSSHSLVKVLNPMNLKWPVLQLSSYTHPEYLQSMSKTFEMLGKNVLFLRGTEGEAVADPRRTPQMTGFIQGKPQIMVEQVQGTVGAHGDYPASTDPDATVEYTQRVLRSELQLPFSIQAQIQAIEELSLKISNSRV